MKDLLRRCRVLPKARARRRLTRGRWLVSRLDFLSAGALRRTLTRLLCAVAVFEILQSMREISRKQKEAEQREKEEKLKNGGLSRRERAELEAKKEEIRRLEAIAGRVGGSEGSKSACDRSESTSRADPLASSPSRT